MPTFSASPRLPFLHQFFESRSVDESDELGTSTLTKAGNESGDTDASAERTALDRQARRATLGTETMTESRESTDADEPRRNAQRMSAGTQTGTATGKEDLDSDVDGRLAQSSGTQTFTRAQENGDTDLSHASGGGPLWTGQLL